MLEPIEGEKQCSLCTRIMFLGRFRLYMKRGQMVRHSRCKNCESGDAMKRQAKQAKANAARRAIPKLTLGDHLNGWYRTVDRSTEVRSPMVARL